MAQPLLDKLRRARETRVDAGGWTFTIRRPTDAEVIGLNATSPMDLVRRFVVGWNLKEIDVVPGGAPEPTPFDPDLWTEWVADQPQLWEPLSTAVLDGYKRHVEAREDAAKN